MLKVKEKLRDALVLAFDRATQAALRWRVASQMQGIKVFLTVATTAHHTIFPLKENACPPGTCPDTWMAATATTVSGT